MDIDTRSDGMNKDIFALDEAKVIDYLVSKGYLHQNQFTRPLISRLTFGQSNPSYLIKGLPKPLVLRKKPPGPLLPSAHQIEREFRILTALKNTNVSIPEAYHFCENPSILGTPFYIMEYIPGDTFKDPNLDNLQKEEKAQIFSSAAEMLGKLHLVRPIDIGLSDYGKPKGFCKRQVEVWWKQYNLASENGPDVTMSIVKDWLIFNLPKNDDYNTQGCITHGDFSISNLVFTKNREGWGVKAIFDWELSTLGDGWLDVAYFCLPYYFPHNPYVRPLRSPLPSGIPTEEEFILKYCQITGKPPPNIRDWTFYKCLSLFRLASICQGIQARSKQGNAASPKSTLAGSPKFIRDLIETALNIIKEIDDIGVSKVNEISRLSSGASEGLKEISKKLKTFMKTHIFPNENKMEELAKSNQISECLGLIEEFKNLAKSQKLWNLFIPPKMSSRIKAFIESEYKDGHLNISDRFTLETMTGAQLTNLEYAYVCEIMGQSLWAPVIFNCNAPDTGNMEILANFGTRQQMRKWLIPLLCGDIRSCFAMTEKNVASSDANNIQSKIEKEGSFYMCNGNKWWTTGAMHPNCKICIFMGKTNPLAPTHKQQSMILVPMDALGVSIIRPMLTFGYDDIPFGHPEILFKNVRVPLKNLLGEEGSGFSIAQARLGPGRLHHCMRLVGIGERALQLMKQRANDRSVSGSKLGNISSVQQEVADCFIKIQTARLLVLHAAEALDRYGSKDARIHIACAKAHVPKTIQKVIDRAIQLHGAAGFSQESQLARMFSTARCLRVADGPDEVHLTSIGKYELFKNNSKL